MADKLRIPGPDEPEDLTRLDDTIFYAWVVSMALSAAIFFGFRGEDAAPEAEPVPDDPVAARQAELVERADLDYATLDWTSADAVAVFRHGPADGARAACRHYVDQLGAGSLDRQVRVELVKAIDRRASHAPWSCLLELLVEDRLAEGSAVHTEMVEFWEELARFEADPAIVADLLGEYRMRRQRPDAAAFDHWLRLCAADVDYAARPACLKTLAQVSPELGADLLDAIDQLLAAPAALTDSQLETIITATGHMARQGQPEAWRVLDTKALPGYDIDLRLGAILTLCRFVNSPDRQVARRAAEQLAEAAGIGARGADQNLHNRWVAACRQAFRATEPPEEPAAPALAVWTGEEGMRPNYALGAAIERGACPSWDDRPAWYCGVALWRGDPDDFGASLLDYFIETRYMEWD